MPKTPGGYGLGARGLTPQKHTYPLPSRAGRELEEEESHAHPELTRFSRLFLENPKEAILQTPMVLAKAFRPAAPAASSINEPNATTEHPGNWQALLQWSQKMRVRTEETTGLRPNSEDWLRHHFQICVWSYEGICRTHAPLTPDASAL